MRGQEAGGGGGLGEITLRKNPKTRKQGFKSAGGGSNKFGKLS